jgi:MHS family citrate/tricarballylate:H+ symporter-like MFS transporter
MSIHAGARRRLPQANLPIKHILAVTLGNGLEFYDFLTYAYFARQIGEAIFPSKIPANSLLASLAAFGVGFLVRPLGALVIGRIADRKGRSAALTLTFVLMGVATVGLALTPSYGLVGVAAPALAVAFRLVQGFALGGEVGPSTVLLMEMAPVHRRGLYISLQFMSQQAAVFAAGLAGLALSSWLPGPVFSAWGWRIAMLLGATVIPLGLLARRNIAGPIADRPPEGEHRGRGADPRIVLAGAVLLVGGAVVSYMQDYLTTYAATTLGMPTSVSFLATVTVGLVGFAACPIGGWLCDRAGRKPAMAAPCIALLAVAVPGFWVLAHLRTATALVGLAVPLALAPSIAAAPVLTAIGECLPPRLRSTALGLIYAASISVFGGSAQFVSAMLTRVSGSPLAPAWYISGALAIMLVAMTFIPETAPAAMPPRPRKARSDVG